MGTERRNAVAEFLSDREVRKTAMDWQHWKKFPHFPCRRRFNICAPEDICL
jgi:hypothetical protein